MPDCRIHLGDERAAQWHSTSLTTLYGHVGAGSGMRQLSDSLSRNFRYKHRRIGLLYFAYIVREHAPVVVFKHERQQFLLGLLSRKRGIIENHHV